jgi:hypothetical protein
MSFGSSGWSRRPASEGRGDALPAEHPSRPHHPTVRRVIDREADGWTGNARTTMAPTTTNAAGRCTEAANSCSLRRSLGRGRMCRESTSGLRASDAGLTARRVTRHGGGRTRLRYGRRIAEIADPAATKAKCHRAVSGLCRRPRPLVTGNTFQPTDRSIAPGGPW